MNSLKHYFFTLCFFLAFIISSQAQHHVNFTHLAPSSDNRSIIVSKTIQDTFGNIWMVQKGDIYIYDGYNYRFINNANIFPNSHDYETIKNIIVDDFKNIWLISQEGSLIKYTSEKGVFEDLTPLINGEKISVITSKNKEIWVATTKGSLFKYANAKMDSITTFPELTYPLKNIEDIALGSNKEVFLSTKDGNVLTYSIPSQKKEYLVAPFNNYPENLRLLTDSYNRLWIGTETMGLFLYDISTKQFIQDAFFKGNTHNIKNELFLNLYADSSGFLWAGTDGGGLYKVNLSTGEVLLFTKQVNSDASLSSNTILHINEDNHKNIWIIPNYGNLNILPNADNNINYHEGSENGAPTRILSIYKGSNGILWAGTDGSGLTKISFNADGSTNEEQFFNDSDTSKGFYIQSITEDNKGNMWIGTYKNGLWFYDSKKNEFREIPVLNTKNQKASDVRTTYKDSKGRIWAGSNTSLNIYSDSLELLASFEYNVNSLKGTIVESIVEAQNGDLWLGIYEGGLFQFSENINQLNASTFLDFSILNDDLDRLKSVKSISEGTYNSLWLINNSGQLLKYDIKNNEFTSFEDLKTLSNRSLAAVINAGNDNLWISSNNGIVNFNTRDSIVKTYFITDGLQDNIFLSRSAFKDHKGLLYFGGSKGFNYFYPKDLNKKKSHPKLQINTIEVLNQPAEILMPDQVASGIPNVKSLRLKYDQSSFSFRFAALDNILYPKHFYAYRLKGFDDDWIYSHLERSATYTNIPAGNYTFEVKAGSRDDVWDIPPKSVSISIEQPFWNKPIAWVLYVFLFALGIYGVRRWYALKKKLFLEKISHQNQNELHELKMNFFAKMSHEIQTPLTLILGPIQDMIHNAEKNGNLLLKQRLNIIAYNTKRLSKIAYELTLVRNKEMDQLRLMVTKSNLYKNIEQIAQSFKELARKKNIDFTINCPKNLTEAWYDKEKLEHIIYNLLSNAFKFTPKEGNILLTVTPINSKKMVRLSVTDSGPGVSKEELNTIFELFYQSNIGKKNKGTGIGLALTKELIDLHKGKIEVESSAISGTTFTITFPIHEDAYSDFERITSDVDDDSVQHIIEKEIVPSEVQDLNVLKKTILIVEDTLDLQHFLKELLQDQYNVILAENGNEGYHYAKSNIPDLILSDIMMPELDGIEMCKKLQEEQLTQHIPIILLTAKNSTQSKIEGLKSGAIEYINKPFNTNELLLKIKNILIAKEHIITKFRKEAISRPEVPQEKSQDEIFLENLVANVNLRLEDANFKMEELAAPLNMSYSTIYRKCQALTGHTLVDFVRMLRLKKAAILITKNGFTISETAFMTGFNDPKYFSKCFKKQFKKSPLNFKKEAQKIGVDEFLNKHEVGSFL
ncbi:hybrid sensor histidine kinase/response regulator transcription factor [Gelidibacter pelagius]|uniref:histidine kinase n=1 Tax=Gelidibacter pelagius TaxID=2819985 RepID=A0ABS3SSN9_9FLAO|nr:ATP-binding protein [Gelidibacter pelagius]MBO3098726.1 response regulator [Gelidibacter pelagius]